MKKLNAFTPYALTSSALYDWCGKAANSQRTGDVLSMWLAKDPHDTEWTSMGIVAPITNGLFVHDLDGTARLMCWQFNERVLPGAVRDEKLRERIAHITERDGRAPHKKDYAQIKEDVESSLLPQAFIRRTLVPVLIFRDAIMFFSTSAKKVEDIYVRLVQIMGARKIDTEIHTITTKSSIGSFLTQAAKTGGWPDHNDCDYSFDVLNAAKLKGGDKRAVTIKDREISSGEVQELLEHGTYNVTEMLLSMRSIGGDEDGHLVCSFVFTDRFTVKGIKLSDVTLDRIGGKDEKDAHVTAWLLASTAKLLLGQLVLALNDGDADAGMFADNDDL